MPVFGTIASRFNDDGVTALYQAIIDKLKEKGLKLKKGRLDKVAVHASSRVASVVPPERVRYLADIAITLRDYKKHAVEQSRLARERQQLLAAKAMLSEECGEEVGNLGVLADAREGKMDPGAKKLLAMWPDMQKAYSGDEYVVVSSLVRGSEYPHQTNLQIPVGNPDPAGCVAALRRPR